MSYYLFFFWLFLAPLPLCFLLKRSSKESHSELHASFKDYVNIKLSGLILVYCLILAVNSFLLHPAMLNINLMHDHQIWKFKSNIVSTDKDTGIKKEENNLGKIKLSEGPGRMIYVNAISKEKNVQSNFNGLKNHSEIIFPLPSNISLEGVNETIVAFGTYHNTKMILDLIKLSDDNAQSSYHIGGSIELERQWPFCRLLFLTFFPLLIILAIDFFSLKKSTVNLNLDSLLPIKNSKLNIRLSGALIVYFFVVSWVYIVKYEHLPHTMNQIEEEALQACRFLKGDHHFKIAKSNAIGKLQFNCGETAKTIDVRGYIDEQSDSDGIKEEIRHNINVILSGIYDSQFLGFYSIENGHKRFGLMSSTVFPNAHHQVMTFRNMVTLENSEKEDFIGQVKLQRNSDKL